MPNPTGKGGFKKGRTGNPKGRPKEFADVKELARQYTKQAIDTLAEIMRDGDTHAARAMAADKLLDRAWGKAPQAITGEDGGPIETRVVLSFD